MGTILRTVWLGLPVWGWALLVLAGTINEVILRSKWTEAKSTWQGLWRTILWIPAVGPFLARFPWVGPLLKRFAGIEEPGLALPPGGTPPTTWLVLCILTALTACGGLKPYYAMLAGAEATVNIGAQRFPDFDKAKRAQIVNDAKSNDEGKKALSAWDDTANKVVNTINGTDASVKLARDGLHDVAAGIRAKSELTAWIGPVLTGAQNLRALLASIGFVLPPGVK